MMNFGMLSRETLTCETSMDVPVKSPKGSKERQKRAAPQFY